MKLCTVNKIVNTLIDFPNARVEFRRLPYPSRHLHPLTLLDHQSHSLLPFLLLLVKLGIILYCQPFHHNYKNLTKKFLFFIFLGAHLVLACV